MLKNFWYAIELSSAVTAQPRAAKVLGKDLVLYRGKDGRVVALDRRCVHRGGDLAGGLVIEGCLRCPYHGWRFDEQGACVAIPANPPGTPVPKAARVESYPTEERYGFVWVFLGELPPAERPPIPPLPELGQPGWRAVYGEFHWRAHYARVMENGMDFAHGPFVHAQSFGDINRPQIPEHQVVTEKWGAHAAVELPAQEPQGLWRWLGGRAPKNVPVRLAFYMPNLIRIHIQVRPGWEVIIFDTNIPVDENNTRTLWVALRSFLRGAWADRGAIERSLVVFNQDKPIVEAVRPVLPPDPAEAGPEAERDLLVRSDRLLVAYRRFRRQCLERGWGVQGERAGPTNPREKRAAGEPPSARPGEGGGQVPL
jgi:phenylpropionate dioxygenase-like ring-hydroxylating dioxygenase large terminal subunit